ncbi:putative signal transduction protein with Nacht domain [Arthrospira platensis C1]|nr:putative signal transduction protein with Nacht domain [Arthrospira platensis C1]
MESAKSQPRISSDSVKRFPPNQPNLISAIETGLEEI